MECANAKQLLKHQLHEKMKIKPERRFPASGHKLHRGANLPKSLQLLISQLDRAFVDRLLSLPCLVRVVGRLVKWKGHRSSLQCQKRGVHNFNKVRDIGDLQQIFLTSQEAPQTLQIWK